MLAAGAVAVLRNERRGPTVHWGQGPCPSFSASPAQPQAAEHLKLHQGGAGNQREAGNHREGATPRPA